MGFFDFLKKKKKIVVKQADPQGEHHDLQEIFAQLNHQYFESRLSMSIRWFGRKDASPKSRIILGAYHTEKQSIKIHRILDNAHIPAHFVRYIVYHEMLHHVFPPVKHKRRRSIHHPTFLKHEKRFQDYALAQEFRLQLRDNLFVSKNAEVTK